MVISKYSPVLSSFALVVTALAITACQRTQTPVVAVSTSAAAPTVNNDVKLGTYRAVLQTPGGELPFGLELAQKDGKPVGYLINGQEKLQLTDVKISGSHLEIAMPGYLNVLKADATGNELQGEVFLVKLNEKNQHVPLRATLGEDYRFFKAGAGDKADVSGRWAVKFIQSHDAVSGTILTTTGDHRYLAGQVKGDELYLSTFDGAHVFLYKAKIGKDGNLDGDWWSGLAYHEKWIAKRDAAAQLPDAYGVTAMRAGVKKFDFAFPDLDGKTVSSQDPKFRGKVMIVALAGSWCPNCHDEAAFLAPLYKDYRDKGLEIVSLQFEHFGDFDRAAKATQRFRQNYGIEYTTLIAGVSDKDEAAKKLPMLKSFVAFPTTVFIDRKGNVRKIHTGYTGPATGDHYVQFVTEVKTTLTQLLAERA
jgi:peroxiredoxin